MSGNELSPAEQAVLVFAARYAHTRQTTAAGMVVCNILKNWDRIPAHTQEQLKREALAATCNLDDWAKLTGKGLEANDQ